MKKGHIIFTSILALGAVAMPLSDAQAATATDELARGTTQLQQLFDRLDMDNSGDVSMQEYMIYHNRPVDAKYGEYFQFRAMDADDNERLTLSEVRNATDPFNPVL